MTTKTLTVLLAIIPVAAILACTFIALDSGPNSQITPVPEGVTEPIGASTLASAAEASFDLTGAEPSGSSAPSRQGNKISTNGAASGSRPNVAPFPTRAARAETGGSLSSDTRESAADSSPAASRLSKVSPGTNHQGASASAAVPAAASPAAANAPRKLPLPLAFQDLDPDAPGLSAAQSNLLNALRADFVREVGGPQQNAHDPRYADRWRALQPRYDEQLRLFFGAAFVEKVALQAAQADAAAGHP